MSSCMEDPQLLVEKAGSFASQTGALACHGQVLAGRSSDDYIDRPKRGNLCVGDVNHASEVGHVWVVMREHGAWERVDFRYADARPAERQPCYRCGFDPGEQAHISHERIHPGTTGSGTQPVHC